MSYPLPLKLMTINLAPLLSVRDLLSCRRVCKLWDDWICQFASGMISESNRDSAREKLKEDGRDADELRDRVRHLDLAVYALLGKRSQFAGWDRLPVKCLNMSNVDVRQSESPNWTSERVPAAIVGPYIIWPWRSVIIEMTSTQEDFTFLKIPLRERAQNSLLPREWHGIDPIAPLPFFFSKYECNMVWAKNPAESDSKPLRIATMVQDWSFADWDWVEPPSTPPEIQTQFLSVGQQESRSGVVDRCYDIQHWDDAAAIVAVRCGRGMHGGGAQILAIYSLEQHKLFPFVVSSGGGGDFPKLFERDSTDAQPEQRVWVVSADEDHKWVIFLQSRGDIQSRWGLVKLGMCRAGLDYAQAAEGALQSKALQMEASAFCVVGDRGYFLDVQDCFLVFRSAENVEICRLEWGYGLVLRATGYVNNSGTGMILRTKTHSIHLSATDSPLGGLAIDWAVQSQLTHIHIFHALKEGLVGIQDGRKVFRLLDPRFPTFDSLDLGRPVLSLFTDHWRFVYVLTNNGLFRRFDLTRGAHPDEWNFRLNQHAQETIGRFEADDKKREERRRIKALAAYDFRYIGCDSSDDEDGDPDCNGPYDDRDGPGVGSSGWYVDEDGAVRPG